MSSEAPFVLLSGSSNPQLTEDIASWLRDEHYPGMEAHMAFLKPFKDGEINVQIPRNVREMPVFVVQSPALPDVNGQLIEYALILDAVRRSSGKRRTAVMPYFPYGRSDRKDRARVAIAAARTARNLRESGARRFLSVDIHNEAATGFINEPWDLLYGSSVLVPVVKQLALPHPVCVAPDAGAVARTSKFNDLTGIEDDIVIALKRKDPNRPHESKVLRIVGDFAGKDALIIDDMISSGGTMCHAADRLRDEGASSVRGFATHGLFNDDGQGVNALDLISNSAIQEIYVTDTIRQRKDVLTHPKVRVVTIAPLLAEAIHRINERRSLSELIL